MPTNPPDDILQHLNTINRHLRGLTVAFEALERAMLEKYAPPRTDGERAAQRSREEIFLTGPQNVKETFDYDLMAVMAKKKQQ